MVPQTSKEHPIATAAFYEMLAAFFLLLIVYAWATSSRPNVLPSIGGVVPTVISVMFSIGIRRGEIATPILGERGSMQGNEECRHIRIALVGSIILAVVITIVITSTTALHRLTGGWAIAVFVVFNLYGWFSCSWWREACQITGKYKAKQKAAKAVARAQENSSAPAANTAPAELLRIGSADTF